MKEQFENKDMVGSVFHNVNLDGASFTDVNLGGATFRDVNMNGATIRNANLGNFAIEDANIVGMTVFGWRIDQLIEAELDRRDPERARLRMADCHDPDCVRGVLRHLDELRADFAAWLRALDAETLLARPAPGEWSALENVRHMLFAEDLYLNRWLLRNERPWCRWGLMREFLAGQPGYAEAIQPCEDLEAVLAAWEQLHGETWRFVESVTPEELHRDTSKIAHGRSDVGQILQGLAEHDLVHIRQAECAVAQAQGTNR
jgi:hypothetical protein